MACSKTSSVSSGSSATKHDRPKDLKHIFMMRSFVRFKISFATESTFKEMNQTHERRES